MSGQWRGSNRRNTLPADWHRTRQRILRRDGRRCTWVSPWLAAAPDTAAGHRCPNPATDVDHIGDPNDHSDSNLRSLCGPHHDARSSAQGVAARAAKPRLRPPEPHPGVRR